MQGGDVCNVGDKGAGVFVGCGGRSGWFGSLGKWLEVLSEWSGLLDSIIDDSDVGVDGVDVLSLCDVAVAGVIVSARERATKRLFMWGWFFQASVKI